MSIRTASILIIANALLSAAFIGAYALWFAPQRAPALAVLDVGELYRLKETQVATVLVKRDSTDDRSSPGAKAGRRFRPGGDHA